MEISQETQIVLRELDRIAMLSYRWNEKEIIFSLKEFYKLYGMEFPKKIEKCADIFDERLKNIFENQAGQAGQAWQARQAWQAGQAGQAWKAWQAGQAGQAGQAWQAWQAGQAGQAWQASYYSSDYWEGDALVFTQEYGRIGKLNEYDIKFIEGQKILLKTKENGLGFFVDDENGTLYIIPCAILKLNSLNQYHSDTLPSIEWKDGESFYYLNGVNFPKELWQEVVSKEMPFEKIMAIEDIDQRTQAIKYGDCEKFLEHAKAKKLDEYMKFRPDGSPIIYRLYKIPKGDIFREDAYYMLYDCPSMDKKYISGVTPTQTVKEAMAWKMDIAPKEWLALTPLISES